jgi:hypothetical protein
MNSGGQTAENAAFAPGDPVATGTFGTVEGLIG